MSELIM